LRSYSSGEAIISRRSAPRLDEDPLERIIVDIQPLGQPPMAPAQALRFAVMVMILGIVAILAATVDPWLLVIMAFLGVTAYAVYDRTGSGWVAA
jgi:hypothetical protein